MNAQARAIIDFLKNTGADDIYIENGGKHPRIRYSWQGVSRFYVIPGSPGDARRGSQQAISDLRRIMGLSGGEKRIGKRRAHRNRVAKPDLEIPTITVAPNPLDGLWSHPAVVARLPVMADRAWLLYWQACLKAAGGQSVLSGYRSYRP